jgi:outer membrane lipoprotein carrier protein
MARVEYGSTGFEQVRSRAAVPNPGNFCKGWPFIIHSLVFLLAAIISANTLPNIHSIAQGVDERYNRLRTLQAAFTEIYRGGGMDRTESGVLWLKRPGKMRWEYRSPREKLFLSDGKDAWFYVPGDRQARRTPVKKLDDLRSPLGLLLGKAKLEKELHGLSLAPDVAPLTSGDVVLRGIPSAMLSVNEVLLEISPDYRIVRIQLEQIDGSVTEYRFNEEKENPQIADQRFEFKPSPETEVVDGELVP